MTTSSELRAIALEEAGRMQASVADADESASVTMTVAQFRLLASMLEQAATLMRDTMFDTQFWVPLAEFERLRSRHKQAQPSSGTFRY